MTTNNPVAQPDEVVEAPTLDQLALEAADHLEYLRSLWREGGIMSSTDAREAEMLTFALRAACDPDIPIHAPTPDSIAEKARRVIEALDDAGYLDEGFIVEMADNVGADRQEFFGLCKQKMVDIIAAEFGGSEGGHNDR